MIKRKEKSDRSVRKTNKGKWDGKGFALHHMMGKLLCILLVAILMVGAFLTPKMLSNLYDRGTLMQIAYTDMDLSTYAVAYTDFPEKIKALARQKSAGNRLAALTIEEPEGKMSDKELIELVNAELIKAASGIEWLFMEGWWCALTEDNLVSRKKSTIYSQGWENAQDMAPFSIWTLTFEVTDKQKEGKVADANGKENYVAKNQFATDSLIVCMDADFYQIYAIAIRGDAERMDLEYGWNIRDMTQFFMETSSQNKESQNKDISNYLQSLQGNRMYVADMILQEWTNYWGVTLKDRAYSRELVYDATDYIGGCLVFQEEASDGVPVGAAGADKTAQVEGGDAFLESTSGVVYYDSNQSVVEVDKEGVYVFEPKNRAEDETYLEVGFQAEWGALSSDNGEAGIYKLGCRDFFEMMQF